MSSPGRRAALLTLVALPALGYGILKLRTKSIVQEARQLEEEGRKNFTLVQDRESKDKDLSVNVGRSGGGV